VLEEADLILLRSEALRPALAHFGALRARVETVRWGVDPARFQRHTADGEAMRRRLELSARDRVLLSPRNLTADSNGTLMIEAMPRVLRAVPHALLLFAEGQADPAYRDGLIGRSLDLGLGDRVRFLGRVEHADMPALYSLAEAVVNIPSADGLTQSLFEAMACEAPLLLGRLPAYAEVVADGDSVLMVDFTADAVAAGMVRLLSDRVVRTWLAGRALARVREVALLPRDAERVEGYYRQLVASRSRRRSRSRTLDALSLFVR
jgi:glycosyltransferase involved in cell wall biosynthesis